MRTQTKVFLLGLLMVLGLTWVGEASAYIPSGGSRLLFYFTKKSLGPGGADNTAFTLLFLTNAATGSATRVGVKYYRADCAQQIGPVFQNIGAGETVALNVAEQAPTFQEGVAEAFFVNDLNQPIRFDQGVGSSLIVDQSLVAVVRLPAAALYSDDRSDFGGTISNNSAATTWAPILLAGQFLTPSIASSRLIAFGPGTVSGTVSGDTTIDVAFRQPTGGGTSTTSFNMQCGRSLTLAQVRGQTEPEFQATFPSGGAVAPSINGQDKGIVAWFVELIQIPGLNILFGQLMQGIGTADFAAHP